MKPYRDLVTGEAAPVLEEFPIATNTAIKPGQVVTLTGGLVVAQAVNGTNAIIGVAAERHTGVSTSIYPRDYGTVISVWRNPLQAFQCAAPKITATGGTATTIIDTTLAATFADDDFNGGYAKLVEKADASTNTDPIGTVYTISDYDKDTTTMTIDTAGGAVTAGDVFVVFPPLLFAKGNLDTALENIVLTATAAIPFKVIGHDIGRDTLRVMATLHQLSNKHS